MMQRDSLLASPLCTVWSRWNHHSIRHDHRLHCRPIQPHSAQNAASDWARPRLGVTVAACWCQRCTLSCGSGAV